jgi:hypothetical protein
MVEDKTESIELLLLRRYSARWRLCGVFFQSTVHSLMPSVLLRPSRLDTFMNNAELHPSQRQLREAQQADSREGCSVVGPNTFWHAVLAHRGIANGAYLGRGPCVRLPGSESEIGCARQ